MHSFGYVICVLCGKHVNVIKLRGDIDATVWLAYINHHHTKTKCCSSSSIPASKKFTSVYGTSPIPMRPFSPGIASSF